MDLLFKDPFYFIKTYFSFSPIGIIVAFVVFSIIMSLLCRRRFKSRIGKWIFIILSSLYLSILVGTTLLSTGRTGTVVIRLNPLDNILDLLDHDASIHQLRGCLSNLVLFVPFGVFSAIFFKKRKVVYSLLTGFFASLIIEILQYVLHRGCAETMDVICNMIGALLGAVFSSLAINIIKSIKLRRDN